MKTITLDILDDRVTAILMNMESLGLIQLHKDESFDTQFTSLVIKYNGAMSKQSIEEIERQISDLRNGWNQ